MSIVFRVDWETFADKTPPEVAVPTNSSARAQVAIEFDGRIDNSAALRTATGIDHRSSVDDLLVASYLHWGPDFIGHLRGDFAVVVFDRRQRRVIAARDPFGVRPLFYRLHGSCLWLSNSIESLLETFDSFPSFDDARVVEHLLATFSATDATFFRDLRQVPPGQVLIATPGGLEARRYWRPTIEVGEIKRATVPEYHEELRRLFVESVRQRLVSDAPVVIHVSGGLDSSAVASAADILRRAGQGAPSMIGVTALYPGLDCDESPFVDAVSRHVGFPIERWNDASEGRPPDLMDPRISEPGIRATFGGGTGGDIACARRHGSSVILSGLGGDQLGMVDGFVSDMISRGQWRKAASELLFFPGANITMRARRIRHALRPFAPRSLLRLRARSSASVPEWLAEDLRPTARDLAVPEASPLELGSNLARSTWQRMTSGGTLRNVSILNAEAAFHGVEYRFPYLNRDLVSFVLSMPLECWPRPGPYARLHRQSFASMLPAEIAKRSGKAEFTPAVSGAVRKAAPDIQLLLNGDWVSSRYIDRGLARQFFGHMMTSSGMPARAWRQLWAVATLEAWIRKILGYHPPNKEVRREGKHRVGQDLRK